MRKISLFFSWQGDIESNHKIIRNGLEKACKRINKSMIKIVYDESMRDKFGAQNIHEVIKTKIENCDIFVADITPICYLHSKAIPNPNVMFELGQAMKLLSLDRIILFLRKDSCDISSLPFDVNHNSIIIFDDSTIDVFYDSLKPIAKNVWTRPTSLIGSNDKCLFNNYNIQRNICLHKYIPDAFLEKSILKDQLRMFSHPILFWDYLYERISRFNFDHLNRLRFMWMQRPFKFELEKSGVTEKCVDFEELNVSVDNMSSHLESKLNEINDGKFDSWSSVRKCERAISDCKCLTAKIFMITAPAGQGKTNFICDFCSTVLIKRKIPFVFLNGFEINPNNIEESIIAAIFPNKQVEFSVMIENITNYCMNNLKPFIVIIDGLNENPKSNKFKNNLQRFLESMLNSSDLIKIVLTCRSDYYQENFKYLEDVFHNHLIRVNNIYTQLSNNEKEILLMKYGQHFKVNATFSQSVKSKLSADLLLLRVFFEANEGKQLYRVDHIYRDELFSRYLQIMMDRIVDSYDSSLSKSILKAQIKNFINHIISYMISNDSFFSVSLSELINEYDEKQVLFVNYFLNENIFFRKDINHKYSESYSNETINFTYDAFRDFLIAHYLIESNMQIETKKNLIAKYTESTHQLKEGLIPFLFIHSMSIRKQLPDDLLTFIKGQNWYNWAFDNYIWELDEKYIQPNDVDYVVQRLTDNPKTIVFHMLSAPRWDIDRFPNLNLRILVSFVENMSDNELKDFINKLWPKSNINVRYVHDKSALDHFIDSMKSFMSNTSISTHKKSFLLIEFFLHIAAFKDVGILGCFKEYVKLNSCLTKLKLVKQRTHSYIVQKFISNIINSLSNEISI